MIIFGLGSNLGNRQENLQRAIDAISGAILTAVKKSKIYETAPLLPPNPEPSWENNYYLNMAIAGTPAGQLTPEDLLAKVKELETQLGRTPAKIWAPRIIDIDILAWDDLVYKSPTLTIPHSGLLERDFAMMPLSDVAPEWVHPQTGIAANEYARQHNLNPISN